VASNAERWNIQYFLPWQGLKIVGHCSCWRTVCFGEDIVTLQRLGCIDLFFAIPFWENFDRFLIVVDEFWDTLINFFPAILTKFGPRTGNHSGTRIDIRPYFVERWAHDLCRLIQRFQV